MEPSKLANAPGCAGKSILELLRDELDTIMDRLMAEGEPDDPFEKRFPGAHGEMIGYDHLDAYRDACREWGEERGRAQGVAYAIALMENPYEVDVPRVKAEAMERWEDRQDDD